MKVFLSNLASFVLFIAVCMAIPYFLPVWTVLGIVLLFLFFILVIELLRYGKS